MKKLTSIDIRELAHNNPDQFFNVSPHYFFSPDESKNITHEVIDALGPVVVKYKDTYRSVTTFVDALGELTHMSRGNIEKFVTISKEKW